MATPTPIGKQDKPKDKDEAPAETVNEAVFLSLSPLILSNTL